MPRQVRRYYEPLARVPEGLVAMGDAICALDPVFGQGMSVGAKEALLLGELFESGRFSPAAFYRGAAKLIDPPWLICSSEAFRFSSVTGRRPFGPALPVLHAFLGRVFAKCADDPEVHRAFLEVMNLEKSPYSLFDPRVLGRLALPLSARVDPGHRLDARVGAPGPHLLAPSLE